MPVSHALTPIEFLRKTGSQLVGAQSVKLMLFFDATSSRERTWKQAQTVQAEILDAARTASHSVELKVGFFRGTECRVTGWSSNPGGLAASMAKIRCQAGRTQILRLMRLAETETATAVIYVGDVFEECGQTARELAARLPMPWYVVQDKSGDHHTASENIFKEISRLTGGAYLSYGDKNHHPGAVARELTGAIAAITTLTTGGINAVKKLPGKPAQALLEQLV